MIELIKAGKYYPTSFGKHYVFRDVSLVLPRDRNIGVIGPNGSGKSTLLRILSGADIPSEGRVVRTGKISWSMGLSPGLQTIMTGAENARFAARINGLSPADTKGSMEKTRELADIGKFFDMPVKTYSAGMRQRLAFALSMALQFDYYLFDEISAGGDKAFRDKAMAMIKDRLSESRFILATHDVKEVLALCQSVILLGDGQLDFFDDAREGLRAYGKRFGGREKLNVEKPKKSKFTVAAERKAAEHASAGAGAPAEGVQEADGVAAILADAHSQVAVDLEERREKRRLARAARVGQQHPLLDQPRERPHGGPIKLAVAELREIRERIEALKSEPPGKDRRATMSDLRGQMAEANQKLRGLREEQSSRRAQAAEPKISSE
ncbi:ABC transporter ATP-binding protein [Aestuariivirga sp.]|uniref:ABC transporter ATP-binding protein n=1 Tax=Aestuariivirga sp. TaxID=2650926 RepID=UPI0039E25E45